MKAKLYTHVNEKVRQENNKTDILVRLNFYVLGDLDFCY